jgi:NAD(P)-dependent dehydrogenase (short-subunit alcohol dehydrogenase family)
MTSEFSGRVAFITGGASGLGRAAAVQLAHQGALVVVADVQRDAAEGVVRELTARGAQSIAITCDVRDDTAVERAVAATVARFGRLDIAINAAGIGGPEVKTAEYAPDAWDRVIDINLNGVWRCMRHEIPAMLASGGGAIVNVSSVAGLIGFPRHPAYAASKHGVVGLTKTAALVQQMIDAGLPQEVLTGRVPMGRLGTPEEVAAAALFLCSSAGAFMSGHALAIDGGIVAG